MHPLPLRFFTTACLALLAGTTQAIEIVLQNGDRLSGDIIKQSGDSILLKHPLLGEITIPLAQLETAEVAGKRTPGKTVAPPPAIDDGFLATGWLSGWERQFKLGFSGSSGESEDFKLNLGFKAGYENEQARLKHETSYYRNEADGDLSDHSLFSLINKDWLMPGSRWFQFGGARLDWDEFKDWDYRLAANGGVGYEFVKTDTYRLLGRAGLGANRTYGGLREEFTLEALLGFEMDWKINQQQNFTFKNKLYPNLRQGGEYRNQTAIDWTLDLNEAAGVGLSLGLTNEYDSLTGEGISSNDFKYTGSLLWQL